MVSDPFLVGVFFGFVPSMGFLYILLHNYEGLFQDKRAFFAYLLGLGAGLAALFLMRLFGPTGLGSTGLEVAEIGLFGLLNALLFAVVLNSKRFRGRRDTTFYGVAFGLGFGALTVLYLVGSAVVQLQRAPGDVWVETLTLSYIGLYLIASILVQACVGAWIGRGAATRAIFGPLVAGAIGEAAYLGGFFLLFESSWGAFLPAVGLAIAILLVARTIKVHLDTIVPPEIRREMEIHQRRLARQSMRDASGSTETDLDAARKGDAASEGTAPPDRPSTGDSRP